MMSKQQCMAIDAEALRLRAVNSQQHINRMKQKEMNKLKEQNSHNKKISFDNNDVRKSVIGDFYGSIHGDNNSSNKDDYNVDDGVDGDDGVDDDGTYLCENGYKNEYEKEDKNEYLSEYGFNNKNNNKNNNKPKHKRRGACGDRFTIVLNRDDGERI